MISKFALFSSLSIKSFITYPIPNFKFTAWIIVSLFSIDIILLNLIPFESRTFSKLFLWTLRGTGSITGKLDKSSSEEISAILFVPFLTKKQCSTSAIFLTIMLLSSETSSGDVSITKSIIWLLRSSINSFDARLIMVIEMLGYFSWNSFILSRRKNDAIWEGTPMDILPILKFLSSFIDLLAIVRLLKAASI